MALKLKSKTDDVESAEAGGPAPQATKHEWPNPAKPSAMLVPTYIRENRALAVTKRKVFYGLVGTVAVTVLGTAAAFLASITSQGSLDDARSAQESAQQKVDRLAPIAQYYDGLEQRTQATVALLSNDVRHADLFDFTNSSLPSNTALTSYTTSFGTPCPTGDPFVSVDAIGCITIAAETDSRAKIPATVASMQKASKDSLVKGVFVNGVTTGDNVVKFTMNLNFTPNALSMKYVPKDEREAMRNQQAAQPPTTPNQDGAQ